MATPSRRRSRVTRRDFTDRIGAPADATNAEVLAALDAKLAARASTTPPASAEDVLYAAVFGGADGDNGSAALAADEDDLYRKAFG